MKINVNDKVLIATTDVLLNSYNGKIAVVKRIFTEVIPPIAYVEIEEYPRPDSITGLKVPLAGLVVIPEKSENETPIRGDESEEITITPDEFKEVACRVIAEETKSCKFVALIFAALIEKIHIALFGEPER